MRNASLMRPQPRLTIVLFLEAKFLEEREIVEGKVARHLAERSNAD
jgi:hypothetical protein